MKPRAGPATLVPGESGRTTEGWQVDQFDHRAVLHLREQPAPGATGPLSGGLDVYTQWSMGHIVYPEDDHFGQAHQQLVDARRV
jgi:extradiol dioxygenase family protein